MLSLNSFWMAWFSTAIPQQPSLSESVGLLTMKENRNRLSEPHEQSAASDLFGDNIGPNQKRSRQSQKRAWVQITTPGTVTITVGETTIEVLAVQRKKTEDLCILLDNNMLTAAFEYIRSEGISFLQPKRAYGRKITSDHMESNSPEEPVASVVT